MVTMPLWLTRVADVAGALLTCRPLYLDRVFVHSDSFCPPYGGGSFLRCIAAETDTQRDLVLTWGHVARKWGHRANPGSLAPSL